MMRFRFKQLTKNGFTLLELVAAMSISVVIYMGSYSLLSQTLLTNEKITEQRASLESLQRAFHIMQQDFEQLVPRAARNASDEGKILNFESFNSRIEFTRLGWRNPIQRNRSNMQRVAYYIEDGSLMREHWSVLDRTGTSEAKQITLLENVTELKYRFLDPKENTWSDDWEKEFGDPFVLPAAIEVIVFSEQYNELKRIFRIVDNLKGDIQ